MQSYMCLHSVPVCAAVRGEGLHVVVEGEEGDPEEPEETEEKSHVRLYYCTV